MNKIMARFFVSAIVVALSVFCSTPAFAQAPDAKEKPPMYSYVGNWSIPRAQWGDMEKEYAAEQKILDKALASGAIVGYGTDLNLVHTLDGGTHDDWYSAMSMAALLNVLDQFYKSGTPTSPVLTNATKHWDGIYVSRHYNWHAGSWKDAYTHLSIYRLKADAPEGALETLSRNLIVPLLEKMLADGAIHEYEIDTEAIHTEAPGMFGIVYVAANAEGLDKVNEAITESLKSNPLFGPAFSAATDSSAHRDFLMRSVATYK